MSDIWSKGPYPAGEIKPLVGDFNSLPSLPQNLPNWKKALMEFGRLIPYVAYDEDRFSVEMLKPKEFGKFCEGFLKGYFIGAGDGLAYWIKDLIAEIALYIDEIPDLTRVSAHEILRGLTEENPKGLSKETQMVFEASELLMPLKLLALLTVRDSLEEMLKEVDILAGDLIMACKQAGQEWIDEFLSETGNLYKQGFLVGDLYGRSMVEVIRIFIEIWK